jgi:hypothetical protein
MATIKSRNGSQTLAWPVFVPVPRHARLTAGGPVVSVVPRIPLSEPGGALAGFDGGSSPGAPAGASAWSASADTRPGAPGKLAGFGLSGPQGALKLVNWRVGHCEQ